MGVHDNAGWVFMMGQNMQFVLNKIRKVAEEFKHPKIALLGLTFKADIDDLRESPAVGIAQQVIQDALGDVMIVEPHIRELPV